MTHSAVSSTREKPAFLITIDTEGDDLWSRPHDITTRNAEWLPRFQRTCESFGFVPTYLVNYEMALSPVFQRFGHSVLERGTAEIGMHLHAWNSPPLMRLTTDDFAHAPYLIEYPDDVMAEKIGLMTRILRNTFRVPITSHRAGRFGFDGRYARILADEGYVVDCSVTPGVSWRTHPGGLAGGPDFTHAPRSPYLLDFDDVCRPGHAALLEVPMTVEPAPPSLADGLRAHLSPRSLPGRIVNRLFPAVSWLMPNGRNRGRMLQVVEAAVDRGDSFVEFMLHSSELMPGGSPLFRTAGAIDKLYADLRAVFGFAQDRFRGVGLSAFAQEHNAAMRVPE